MFFDSHLEEGDAGVEALDEKAREGLGRFVEVKMKQLKAYDKECAETL